MASLAPASASSASASSATPSAAVHAARVHAVRPAPEPQRRWRRLAWALLPVLAACGGGSGSDGATAEALDGEEDRSQALATTTAVGALRLASSTAAAAARSGDVCGVSADGNLVLFSSAAADLVAGDGNLAQDLFLKNLATGSVTRVSTTSTGGPLLRASTCLGMTPDGRFVALQTETGGSGPYQTPVVAPEAAIFVKNLVTGALTRVTPPLATFPQVRAYQFAGLSSNGLRVAVLAAPTTTYLGGYETRANGPARALVFDLSNPAAVRTINLEAQVRFTVPQGAIYGDALLSPDGQMLAFSTAANYPELGDGNGRNDLFAIGVDTLALRQLNTDSAGNAVGGSSTLFGPSFGLQGFVQGGRSLAVYIGGDNTAGTTGIYTKHLDTGELRQVMATAGVRISGNGFRLDVSLADAGTTAAFVRRASGGQGTDVPVWRNLLTGQERNAATTASGTASNGRTTTAAALSADGSTVVFSNNGTNLGSSNRGAELRTYAKTVAAPAALVAAQ